MTDREWLKSILNDCDVKIRNEGINRRIYLARVEGRIEVLTNVKNSIEKQLGETNE
jgi:hypothetical protein